MDLTRTRKILLAIALLSAAACAAAQEDAAPQQKIFNSNVFPASSDRPPLWKFRTLKVPAIISSDTRALLCSDGYRTSNHA